MVKRNLKVLKFGGTSMSSPAAIGRVASIVAKQAKGPRVAAVVVSAMGGVTDELIKIATFAVRKDSSYKRRLTKLGTRHLEVIERHVSARNRARATRETETLLQHLAETVRGIRLTRALSLQALDYIMSYGERLSAHLLVEVLRDRGVEAEYLNARKIITTDAHFGAATIDFAVTNRKIKNYFHAHKKLQVTTGFIAATRDRRTTTIGRGGSDYSAAIIGAALSAKVIEVWTDVSGIYSADPRLVPGARVVPELAFEEAGELAYFGAKVLHPKTILPAMREKIPVRILNTFRSKDEGTTIVASFAERRKKSKSVEAITFKRPVVVVHLQSPEFFDEKGLMARIFDIFNAHRTSVDVVATSVAGVTLTIDNQARLKEIVRDLKKYGEVSVERQKAVICAVGGSVNAAGVAGRMFTALGKSGIAVELISQAAAGISITFVVRERDAEKALRVLHRTYIRA